MRLTISYKNILSGVSRINDTFTDSRWLTTASQLKKTQPMHTITVYYHITVMWWEDFHFQGLIADQTRSRRTFLNILILSAERQSIFHIHHTRWQSSKPCKGKAVLPRAYITVLIIAGRSVKVLQRIFDRLLASEYSSLLSKSHMDHRKHCALLNYTNKTLNNLADVLNSSN